MKHLFYISAISISLLFLASCGNGGKQANPDPSNANSDNAAASLNDDATSDIEEQTSTSLSTALDSVSYALGVDLGNQLISAPQGFELGIVAQALNDIQKGEAKMTREDAITYMQMYQQKDVQRQTERNKEAGKKFLEENKGKKGVVALPSGLQYQIIKEGTGPKPKATDVVEVHYKGTLLDGREFDSSYGRGETATFGLNQVIKGWTEGLQHIKEGSKVMFFIPEDLAYGANPMPGGIIEPYMTLIFEIELIKVIPQN